MINTWSKFIYGTTIHTTNNKGDFQEGATEFAMALDADSYTLGELLAAVEDALNEEGDNTYTVTISRTTGLVTIAANSTFSLLLLTGDNQAQSFWSLLGFSQAADRTGAATYTGTMPAASVYYPQFLLQSYVSPNDFQMSIEPTVNRTMSGRTELVRFGVDRMIEMDLQFITDKVMDGVVIKNNPSGVADAQAFLQDITGKTRFEFVPDIATPGTFYKVVLDAMPGYKDGSAYKLKELFMQNLPGIFQTGVMTLRVVT